MQKVLIERNPIFEPLWTTKKRYVAIFGSAGSGKSVDTAQMYIVRIMSEVGRNLLCIRKSYDSNGKSTYSELVKAISRMGVGSVFTCTTSPLKIVCSNGNEINFGGVYDDRQRESIKSITAKKGDLTDIWIEEATEITDNDFEVLDDRLRGILPKSLFYQIRMTFNPVSSAHWIKKRFFDYCDNETFNHHSTYLDNVFCDEAYYKRMERRKLLDPDGYKIYGLGEWGETSGLIFNNYVIEEFPDSFDYVRYGQDFGFNHANALLKIGIKDNEVYVSKELYVNELTTDDIIKLAADWDKRILMYCDSAEPDRIMMWHRAGFNAIGASKYAGSVKYSIDWLKQRKIHIHPDCTNTISEISQWRWKKDRDSNYTDEPVPFNDDAMAALRYGCFDFIPQGDVFAKQVKPTPHYNFASERPKQQIGREENICI